MTAKRPLCWLPALVLAWMATACATQSAPPTAQADAALAPDATVAQDSSSVAADITPADIAPAPVPMPWLGPTALADDNPDPHVFEATLIAGTMDSTIAEVPVQLFVYNDQLPGPTIRVHKGDQVIIHFQNDLTQATTVHWHGLRISSDMDGNPRIQAPVKPGETFTYTFTPPDAGTFWYHPHVAANVQVERGLHGMFIVEEPERIDFARERGLVLDDILLTKKGIAAPMAGMMEGMHGRLGNVLLVNGATEPLQGEAKVGESERWRLVNTSNARTMPITVLGAEVRVIGTDGGLLSEPYALDNDKPLMLAVGKRYDLEVRYTTQGTAQLQVLVPVAQGNTYVWKPIDRLQVEVGKASGAAQFATLPMVPPLPKRDITETATIKLDAVQDAMGGLMWTLNGKGMAKEPLFTWPQGATVQLTLANLQNPEHPFHLHGQFFEILARNGKPVNEPGLHDVVLLPGKETVKLRAWIDNPGQWMAHCHILEHAELGMMAEFIVTPTE